MTYLHAQLTNSAMQAPSKEFRYLFVAIFCAFLLLAMMGQLMLLDWRNWLPGAEGSRSMYESVKSAVYTVISQFS